jgi:hypothetical protein
MRENALHQTGSIEIGNNGTERSKLNEQVSDIQYHAVFLKAGVFVKL